MPRPRGVAFLVHDIDAAGGMERQADQLARRLAARGLAVTVVSTFVPGRARAKRRELREGVEVLRVALPWWTFGGAERIYEAFAATKLWQRRRRVSAIYAVHARTGAEAAVAGRILGRPVLVKLACPGPHGDFASLEGEPEQARYLANLQGVARVLCLSKELEKEAIARGFSRAALEPVRNGVDRRVFTPEGKKAALAELGTTSRIVLSVGRLDAQKRLDVLIRAFASVSERLPDARLAIAGTGPLAGSLERLASSLGLAGKVAFLGRRDDVAELLRRASVFVLPSEAEGLSNALLEALATGAPVVCSDIEANRALVANEREALLVPPGDAPALAAAIERVLSVPELASRLAASGRELVARELDLERVAERHLRLFEAVSLEKEHLRSWSELWLIGVWIAAIAVTLRDLGVHALRRLL